MANDGGVAIRLVKTAAMQKRPSGRMVDVRATAFSPVVYIQSSWDVMTMKQCRKCSEAKNLNPFHVVVDAYVGIARWQRFWMSIKLKVF